MHVVVTGANGRLGRVVVQRLLAEGMEVSGIDKELDSKVQIPLTQIDLRDLGQFFGALAGAEAVVHLGAIPSPRGFPPEVVYLNNIMSQFNIFEAAAVLGIHRVVSASSVSAYGFPFQHRWSEPLYLPLDEAHPLLPQDAYGLSKANGEEIAAAYTRRTGDCAVSLRISTIVDETTIQSLCEYMQKIPEAGAPVLWSYVHVNDVAQAVMLSLTRPLEGHQIFHITANDTVEVTPTDELLNRWFPQVPRRKTTDDPYWSLIDGQRAETVLGYVPGYRWPQATGQLRPGEMQRFMDKQEKNL